MLAAINKNDQSLMLLMRSVAILILIYSNISDDTRLERSLNDFENFLLNIMLCLRNDRFRQFYTAVCHNDSDCSVCHLSHISLSRLRLSSSKMMTIVSVR